MLKKGCDRVLKLGLLLFLVGGVIIFGSDMLFKRRKITTLKSLLITKLIGLGITIAASILMIYGK